MTPLIVADLQRYVERALAVFGPGRMLFGSDWPVCLLAAPYEVVFETARQTTAGLSPGERAKVFGGTAERAYGLV